MSKTHSQQTEDERNKEQVEFQQTLKLRIFGQIEDEDNIERARVCAMERYQCSQ